MFGINQSKNASSASSNVNTTDSNNDNSYGSHNLDQSGASIRDTAYDSHGVVNAQNAQQVTVTDNGATNSAIDAIKGVALAIADRIGIGSSGSAAGGEGHYDGAAAQSKVPTVAYIAGGLVLVGLVVVVVVIARRK